MTPDQAQHMVNFLNSEDPFHEWKVGDVVYCLHCEKSFKAEEVHRHFRRGQNLVACPTDGCDGAPHDWSPEPWQYSDLRFGVSR